MQKVDVYNYTGASWNGGAGFGFPAGGPFPITYAQYDNWRGGPPYPKAVVLEKIGITVSYLETDDFNADYVANFYGALPYGMGFAGMVLTIWILRLLKAAR